MTITEKAEMYHNYFEAKKRDNGTEFVCLKLDAPEELKESIREAHGDKLPDDWTYGTYADLMQRITEYDLETFEQLEDVRGEIVESYVDIYTKGLTEWLNEDINNVYYITRALEEFGNFEDGFKLLATAQYMAIDEVMQEVVNLLSK